MDTQVLDLQGLKPDSSFTDNKSFSFVCTNNINYWYGHHKKHPKHHNK